MMELSAEDSLRLNVMLAQDLQAVRIDDSKMIVYGLTEKGEAKVPLNPNCKSEKYIKLVKEVFSTHVMGSPGGYPVFLKRWTRMGQARDGSLQQMLLLGEPEAVIAAVHAPGLTDELAERAWWIMPTSDNARQMLAKEAVSKGKTGRVLADFLLEFLPFEEEQSVAIDTVRLLLQPDLITDDEKNKLWSKAKTKNSFYVGFMHAIPDDLPGSAVPNPEYSVVRNKIKPLTAMGNRYALLLEKVLGEAGQCFIGTAQIALKKPSDQYIVISLLEALSKYFSDFKPSHFTQDNIDSIQEEMKSICNNCNDELKDVLNVVPEMQEILQAMLVLSCVGVKLVNPVFAQTDAIGSGMRKKIKRITDPISYQLKTLLEKA